MKNLKIGKKTYILEYSTHAIDMMNNEDIYLNKLAKEVEEGKTSSLYKAFYYGLKKYHRDVNYEEAKEIIDDYFREDEDNDLIELMMIVVEELGVSMGLGKMVRQQIEKMREKKEKEMKK